MQMTYLPTIVKELSYKKFESKSQRNYSYHKQLLIVKELSYKKFESKSQQSPEGCWLPNYCESTKL